MAGEILVVIGALRQRDARRLLLIALQERRDIVRTLFLELAEEVDDEPGKATLIGARLRDQGKVGRQTTTIGGPRRLLVREWRGEVVGGPAGPFEHIALIVRAVLDLVIRSERGHLRGRIAWTAGIGEVPERDIGQPVAVGA